MSNYISENMSHQEVLHLYRDQVPAFMLPWLEKVVEQAQDGVELFDVIYMNSQLSTNTVEAFAKEFSECADKANEYDGHVETISDLEQQVTDLEKENQEYRQLLDDNGIEY